MSRSLITTVGLAALVTLSSSCSDSLVDPEPDVTSAEAPKNDNGNKGEKDDGGGGYTLDEYFVFDDGSGGNLVHVAGSGDLSSVNLNVVHDNNFNGRRDDDRSVHYEYTTFAPLPVSVEGSQNADGTFHVDIPWNGSREVSAETGAVEAYFADFEVTSIDGGGADPFAFVLSYLQGSGADASLVESWEPQGIIVDGGDTGEAEAALTHRDHGSIQARSYAVFQGGVPRGHVYLTELTLSSVTCDLVTIREGRGKNRTSRDVAVVSGEVTVRVESTTGSVPSTWMEVHLVDVTNPAAPVFTDRATATTGYDRDGMAAILTREFDPPASGSLRVAAVVDYVFPTDTDGDLAYAPSLNADMGFSTEPGPLTALGGPPPLAMTPVMELSCGG